MPYKNTCIEMFLVYLILSVENLSFIYFCPFFYTSEMTSLSKGVTRSEVICMLSVPAKMTCIELIQFVAPSE